MPTSRKAITFSMLLEMAEQVQQMLKRESDEDMVLAHCTIA